MAIRKEQSTYTTSNLLKAALVSKGILDLVDVNHAYYSGGATEIHLLISDMSDGSYRSVVKTGSGVTFDFVDSNDPLLVRMWTMRELTGKIGKISNVSFSDWTKPGANYVYKITHNGIDYLGTDANLPDSACKALLLLCNALPAEMLKG